ncbi:MAG: antirestriction protein ArdA [Gordonia sp. (in: high G+C Gram-positive bacteria)]|uniref:antirestriction protein ArdA n=1 Tax=Gordonia sp. (in: high G+C Gram-positive bacteria) TaxID=84139 RepID=UPI0039E57175
MNHETSPKNHDPEREHQPLHPRIYVASLADYVNGRLHGRWIDAATDEATIYEQIAGMLAASPEPDAEEFAIHDYDEFGAAQVGEYDQIDDVVKLAKLIAKYGESYASYADSVGITEATEDDFTARYAGNYPSVEAYVDSCIDDWGWNQELDQLQSTSSIGKYLAIDRGELIEAIWSEWDVMERPDGTIDIFSPQ